ncbi:MAG: hypothetical protein ABFQ65_03085 [Nanoarchaeota archaeon]
MKKEKHLSKYLNYLIILFSVFIGLFFLLYELLGITNPIIILSSTIFLVGGFIFLSKKFPISNYILLPVIIVDGFFHLTSPLENLVENSPDWVIAFNLYGGNGMPVIIHQIMGVFLLITSAIFIYNLISKKENWYYYFYKYIIAIITMTIISISYFIKLFF